jgi:hypothetical protein
MTTHLDLSLFADQTCAVDNEPTDAADVHRTQLSPLALEALRLAKTLDVAGGVAIDFAPLAASVYAEVKTALASAGFVWNSKRKTHLGSVDDIEDVERIRESGSFYDSNRALEFFATSRSGADVLARLLARDRLYGGAARPRTVSRRWRTVRCGLALFAKGRYHSRRTRPAPSATIAREIRA